jgi:hypothetical protein
MILINIDSLSTTELQYIAQQEGLATWQSLDREALIDALEEAFEDQDDEIPAAFSFSVNNLPIPSISLSLVINQDSFHLSADPCKRP